MKKARRSGKGTVRRWVTDKDVKGTVGAGGLEESVRWGDGEEAGRAPSVSTVCFSCGPAPGLNSVRTDLECVQSSR